MATVHLIWAQSREGVIGNEGGIPWHLPEDLQHFKDCTTDDTVIMGRKTWESLPKKPLPNRRNIVLTSDANYTAEGAEVVPTLEEALAVIDDHDDEVWIIGGAGVYEAALQYADGLHITDVDISVVGDTRAPNVEGWVTGSEGEWEISSSGLHYRFRVLRPASSH